MDVQPCVIRSCGMFEVNGGLLMLIVCESVGFIWLGKECCLTLINTFERKSLIRFKNGTPFLERTMIAMSLFLPSYLNEDAYSNSEGKD